MARGWFRQKIKHRKASIKGWESRYKRLYSHKLRVGDAIKINERRTPISKRLDAKREAPIVKIGTWKGWRWVRDPSHYDLKNFDAVLNVRKRRTPDRSTQAFNQTLREEARRLNLRGFTGVQKMALIRPILKRGIDPRTLDLEAEIDTGVEFSDAKEKVNRLIGTTEVRHDISENKIKHTDITDKDILNVIRDSDAGNGAEISEVITKLQRRGHNPVSVENKINNLITEGKAFQPERGRIKPL